MEEWGLFGGGLNRLTPVSGRFCFAIRSVDYFGASTLGRGPPIVGPVCSASFRGGICTGRTTIMPVPKKIGVLYSGTKKSLRKQLHAFLEGLKEEDHGFVPANKLKIKE